MRASVEQVWEWLNGVPDPEIPVVSVVELGIVRDVHWQEGNDECEEKLVVTVTPTYSGCPATSIIALDVEMALRSNGIKALEIKNQIMPPWTTNWLTREAMAKLKAYGIAPPNPSGRPKQCPRCSSFNVTKVSQYGSTPCKAQWRCADCLEPFDYFKCH